MKENKILDVKVHSDISLDESVSIIEKCIQSGTRGIVCTTNPEFIIDAQSDVAFKNIINSSLLSIPDGFGTVLASEYLKKVSSVKRGPFRVFSLLFQGLHTGLMCSFNPICKSISGVDLTYALCKLAAEKGYTVAFLGGRKRGLFGTVETDVDVATLAASNIKKLYPKLNVVVHTSVFSYKESDDQATVTFIRECMQKFSLDNIDIVFVAYNHVNQEKWLDRNLSRIPGTVGVGVGGTLDYISNIVARPPKIFRLIHLEWLYRLLSQPWRYKRIFKAFPYFPLKVFLSSLKS